MTWTERLSTWLRGAPPTPPIRPPSIPEKKPAPRPDFGNELERVYIVRIEDRAIGWGLSPNQARDNAWAWVDHDHEQWALMDVSFVLTPRCKVLDLLAMLGLSLNPRQPPQALTRCA